MGALKTFLLERKEGREGGRKLGRRKGRIEGGREGRKSTLKYQSPDRLSYL